MSTKLRFMGRKQNVSSAAPSPGMGHCSLHLVLLSICCMLASNEIHMFVAIVKIGLVSNLIPKEGAAGSRMTTVG